jgi:hypothetical protein
MRWIIPMLCFFGGAMFGMLTMALMVASSREERNEEVMTDAGGSGKQDCEPGDQHVEAERTYHSLSGPGLSEPSEECKGKEGA